MKSQGIIQIKENIILAPYTSFQIGGPARYFVEVSAEEALLEALNFAKDNNLEILVLGGGSNVLVSDDGFSGLVIKLATRNLQLATKSERLQVASCKFQEIECWAGESLASLARFCAESSLSGMEWAAGIPGTVGGAIRGNAGTPQGCMADNIKSVRIIDMADENQKSKIKSLIREECNFFYRDSIFKKNQNLIILSCIVKLQEGDRKEIEDKMKEILQKRSGGQPSGFSPGSFFKNPVVSEKIIREFEIDKNVKCKDNRVPAGWLIDQVGLRGKKIGGVQISPKHANFIVNLGHGKAEEVVILASVIKQKIRHEFDVQLQEEVQYVGF